MRSVNLYKLALAADRRLQLALAKRDPLLAAHLGRTPRRPQPRVPTSTRVKPR